MKCKGNKCPSYSMDYFYPICLENKNRTNIDCECGLSEMIKEVRNDLIRRCSLFEELLDMECGESLEEMVKEM